MATKKNNHMGDQSGQPKMQSYKFDVELDNSIKAGQYTMSNMDGAPIVMPGAFKARRDAQIANRKRQGK